MNLDFLGFSDAWARQAETLLQPGHTLARVTAVDRGAFLVRNAAAEIHAELAGKLRFATSAAADLPCVGDWVGVQWPPAEGPAIIHAVLPRRSHLRRKTPGKSVEIQMIAANIDAAFIVQGCPFDFNLARLDRYLVTAHDGRIEPRIILSKTDLVTPDALERLIAQIRDAGITAEILPLSSSTGDGLAEFQAQLLPGRTYCLLGSSGVGKTTLINRLLGREAFDTRSVSSTGEGVHTTSRRHLLMLDNGAMLVDTPGMRELGLVGTDAGLDAAFQDIGDFARDCRFPDCTHMHEPGCAVLAALDRGDLNEERYESFLKLRKEAAFHSLSYAEKRQKDKAFGRFVKSALKQMRE